MSNTVIFITQLATVLAFISTSLVLYRLLVSQKDATIEALKEQNNLLKEQLRVTESQSPSVLADTLTKRIEVYEQELNRLLKDKDKNEELIKHKEKQLSDARKELIDFEKELGNALDALEELEGTHDELEETKEALSEFLCPHCGGRLVTKEYGYEPVEYEGRDLEIEHEIITYECGYSIHNGEERYPCRTKTNQEQRPKLRLK